MASFALQKGERITPIAATIARASHPDSGQRRPRGFPDPSKFFLRMV
jgi:hypothetical protein